MKLQMEMTDLKAPASLQIQLFKWYFLDVAL